MAMVVSISGEDRPRKSSFRSEKKTWMLKDYLRDDMSSCSSNGFRSFPRRQCCAAVRNIIEKEVMIRGGGRKSSKTPKGLARSGNFSSVLQRASSAIINAVKLLPFTLPAGESVIGAGEKKRLLPRSFSKKLFKKSFWLKKSSKGERKVVIKEECDEIERWISSGVVGSEKYQPLDLSNDTTVTSASTTTSNSNSDGKSDSWSDITFSSDNFTSSSENDAVEGREKSPVMEISGGVGVTAGEDSVEPAPKSTWSNEEGEEEQFSPISVLEFQDNDEGSSSPFTLRFKILKGTKERLMKKLGRFESLPGLGLEPVNLEGLISTTEIEDFSSKFSIQPCSTPTYIISSESEDDEDEDDDDDDEEEEEEVSQVNEVEEKVEHLLDVTRENISTKTTWKFEPDNLLVDFFRENIMEKEENILLKAAKDWLNGHYDKLILGWEVKDKRQAYIRDMEEGGKWPNDTKLEKEEVAIQFGDEVLANLIEELLVELVCSS